MAKKRAKSGEECGNWMDTYGDMVTLLLTFFVMLYAMSSLNEAKWEVFVKSINPYLSENQEQVVVNGEVVENGDESSGLSELSEDMANAGTDTLYLTIAERLNEQGIDGVTISRGENYTYISFDNKMFFDGDSSTLTETGKVALQVLSETISPVNEALAQINIMAHTAQGEPRQPNRPRTDRMLSAMRAAEVCIYIQEKNVIDPGKIVNISYGQFRPIASNLTREGRAKNRRVEILLVDSGSTLHTIDEYLDDYHSEKNADKTIRIGEGSQEEGYGFTETQSTPENAASMLSPLEDSIEEMSVEDNGFSEDAEKSAGVIEDSSESLQEDPGSGINE